MARLAPETLHLPHVDGQDRAPEGLRAAVVGGGIAGVAAATILAERGVSVTLIEREPQLGGRAGGFPHRMRDGSEMQMERGFHAFFRQYYNLKDLLRRIDPELSMLTPLSDYPILGRSGLVQSFEGLPKRTPFQLITLVAKTPHLTASNLMRVNGKAALEMLRFDMARTYERHDDTSAAAYLDSLRFPTAARQMLFDVFAHSFFNPEETMSAAELLMMFHFYFTGNPEGLVFDVANRPLGEAIWRPFATWLQQQGVDLRLGTSVTRVDHADAAGRQGFVVHERDAQGSDRSTPVDMVVLALDPAGARSVVGASPALSALRSDVAGLDQTDPFAVWRLWLDRPMAAERAPFAGTTGLGWLDNISVYERFQDESAAWAEAKGGSVVELHAYAVPPHATEAEIRADLLRGFHELYPEARDAQVLDECFLLRDDCPGFGVGQHARRPGVVTSLDSVVFAGDGISVPIPCALMERATVSGVLAANTLLARHGVRSHPIRSVPRHGLLSPLSRQDSPEEDYAKAARLGLAT